MIGDTKDEKIIFGIKIFLLIIEIIVIGIVAFIFFGVSKVNAASIDYNNTGQYIHKTFPTDEWITLQRATDYTLTSSYVYNQVNIQWQNYQPGVANGVAQFDITSGTLATYTCSDIMQMIRVVENGTDTGATLRNMGCIIGNNRVRLQVGFVTSVIGTNSYLEVQLRQSFTVATNINVLGVMTVNSIDPATNTDIQDQTNALTQVINDIKNNIINQMQDNLKTCTDYNNLNGPVGTENKYLNTSGVEMSDTNWNISDYIKIQNGKTYTLTTDYNPYQASYCLYDNNKTQISCTRNPNVGSLTFTPNQEGYVRFSINALTGRITRLEGQYCQDRTQAEIDELQQLRSQLMHSGEWEEEDDEVKNGLLRNIISGIGNIFSFLQDDDIDDPSSAIEDIEGDMISDTPISDLLLLPVTLYQKVLLQINGNCSAINLGQLWGEDLIITCINIQDIIGSTLYGTIDILISGFFILAIRKKFIEIFENLSSLHTRRNELE